jgi:hypothetical protein
MSGVVEGKIIGEIGQKEVSMGRHPVITIYVSGDGLDATSGEGRF